MLLICHDKSPSHKVKKIIQLCHINPTKRLYTESSVPFALSYHISG
ncbi:hypothetical protein HMPREF9166_2175 [Selenomonas sp. oral taxon 149 str. 67H29BP]|nr:hypothetical protein HMPREF9166_2175 [Selenomonas sp. oral taxon 149 str. 67H29BP]